MAEKQQVPQKKFSADWFMRGALTRIGDSFDRLTGRRYAPSSSLATSELIERLKKLLDEQAKEVPGKGIVVPHNIQLRIQWDKFSTDADESLGKLQNDLLAAAADHINDKLYYTKAPLDVQVRSDYFTEGVKLLVSFDTFSESEHEVGLNVTIPAIQVKAPSEPPSSPSLGSLKVTYDLKGSPVAREILVPSDRRVTLGRSAPNSVIIDDDSVSKVHAAIGIDEQGNLSIADTGSTNGTSINGERIAYGKAVGFTSDDRITLGSVDLKVEYVAPVGATDELAGPDDDKTVAVDEMQIGDPSSAHASEEDNAVDAGADESSDAGSADAL